MNGWQYHKILPCRQEVYSQFLELVGLQNVQILHLTLVENVVHAQVLISPVGMAIIAKHFEK